MCLGLPAPSCRSLPCRALLSPQLLAQVLSLFLNQMWSIFSGFMVPYPGGPGEACWQRCMCDVSATPVRSARKANHLQLWLSRPAHAPSRLQLMATHAPFPPCRSHWHWVEVDEPHQPHNMVRPRPPSQAQRCGCVKYSALCLSSRQAHVILSSCTAPACAASHLRPVPCRTLQDPVRPGWITAVRP